MRIWLDEEGRGRDKFSLHHLQILEKKSLKFDAICNEFLQIRLLMFTLRISLKNESVNDLFVIRELLTQLGKFDNILHFNYLFKIDHSKN